MKKRKSKLLYKLSPPNEDLLGCGWRLRNMQKSEAHRLFETDYRHGPINWIDPEAFERACADDKKLARALDIAQRGKYTAVQLKRIQKEISRIFEEVVLVAIVEKFQNALPQIRDYFAAKYAHNAYMQSPYYRNLEEEDDE